MSDDNLKATLELKLAEMRAAEQERETAARASPDNPYAPAVLAALDKLAALNREIRTLLDSADKTGETA